VLQEIVLGGWALTMGLAVLVGGRTVLMLRRPHGQPVHSTTLETDADRLAVEQLLAEVGGVVDLIEADAARLEPFEDGRTLNLASALLSSSIHRYQEAVAPEG
jgi:hypothetical protein